MRRQLFFLIAVAVLAAVPVFGQQVPEIAYDSVPNFLKMPDGLYMGEAAGVAQNSKGNVFVSTRSGETALFEFDQDGKFVREIARASMRSPSRIRCASIRRTTSGSSTKART